MTYIIAVSKAGVDATEATDPKDFIFHSSYNTLKIVASGTGSFVVSANVWGEDHNIIHDYGTRTGFMIFFKFPNTGRIASHNNPVDDSGGKEDLILFYINNSSSRINLKATNTSGSAKTIYYKYFLFEVPL